MLARDVRRTVAQAMVDEALRDLKRREVDDVSISSLSYGFEADAGLARELQRIARARRLDVEQEPRHSYFTFSRSGQGTASRRS